MVDREGDLKGETIRVCASVEEAHVNQQMQTYYVMHEVERKFTTEIYLKRI